MTTWIWDGHSFGSGTDDHVERSDLGQVRLRAQRAMLPQNHGGVAGEDFAGGREPQVDLMVVRGSRSAAWQAWLDWNARMQPSSTDGELRWSEDGSEYLMFVRPQPLVFGGWKAAKTSFEARLRWDAVDPAIYGPLTQTQVEPYVGTTLASYPETWPALGDYPKLYGSGGSGGGVTVSNDGKWPSWPRFLIDGPSSGTMSVTSLEDVTHGETLQFTAEGGLSVPAGSTLVVDTHPARRLVAFTDGASRMSTVVDLDSWWALQPGETEVRFRAGGDTAGASATVQYRDAWL